MIFSIYTQYPRIESPLSQLLPSGAGIDLYPVLLLFFGVSIAIAFIALCDVISDKSNNDFYSLLGLIGFILIITITIDVVFGIKLLELWSELWRQFSLRFL